MNEVRFTKLNKDRWQNFESALGDKNIDPDYLAQLFIELSDDLAYSQTYFPDSKTTKYLNQLTSRGHHALFKRRKTGLQQLVHFFTHEYPTILYQNRRFVLYAFLFFSVFISIGVFSLTKDQNFVRSILGDAYVNTTLDNIDRGDPLGIYDTMGQWEMFFHIAWNNIKVSFIMMAAGALLSVGSIYLLFQNGIMLGVFQFFFIQRGLAKISFMTIWLHGTIEIFAIVVAGGAGLMLGNSILFPKTFSRKESIADGGFKALKVVLGLVPFFIIAAFIESFITRHSEESYIIDAVVIGISVLLILFYFFIYPHSLNKKQNG